MKIEVRIYRGSDILYRTAFSNAQHLPESLKQAMTEFRYRFPDVSLLDDAVFLKIAEVADAKSP